MNLTSTEVSMVLLVFKLGVILNEDKAIIEFGFRKK